MTFSITSSSDGLAERLLLHVLVVLRGDDDRVDADRHVVLVLERDLRLAVGAEEVDLLRLADRRELARELVRVVDRRGHEVRRLVARVAEHEALIAGALLLVHALAFGHALGDVGALLLDRRDHRAGVGVEAHLGARVPDVAHGLADDLRVVDRRASS